ncbi:MAG: sugar phosphate isomerase/epimerase [Oscillospiraceae bacterium]|nr:sugar phosphate isomerase/epimerase [Oscillospiraceae bacterium]
MKLAFSTVGCPDWSFDEIFAAAKDFGYDAIEIRGIKNEIYAPKLNIFNEKNIEATAKKLKDAGLFVSMLASNAVIGLPEAAEAGKKEAFEYIDLAAGLRAPFVRIMISPRPEAEKTDTACAVSVYSEICAYAKGKGVTPLIETNGIFAESGVLAGFMEKIPGENKGVLWDINHPCRFFSENAQQVFGNIGKYVKYLHIKDSATDPKTKKLEYRMVGHGDLPISDILKLMAESGYDGVLSLEWTKRWLPELQEPGIVFSQYVNYMRYLIGSLR